MSGFPTIDRIFGRMTGCGSAARRLLRETRSATAVEFAMIGSVLFLFLFSIFLLGIVQFWQLVFDDAVRNAARQVAIGVAGVSGVGATSGLAFATDVCNEFSLAGPNFSYCLSNVQYVVQSAPTFSAITPATVNSLGVLKGSPAFSGISATGGPIGINARGPFLVQAAYVLPINIPLLPAKLLTLNGTPALVSAVASVAEP